MKIRVTRVPPIEKKHGVLLGNEYEALDEPGQGRHVSVWIMGAVGEKVKLLVHEWEEIDADEEE